MDIKINFAVCAVNGWSGQIRTVECMCIRHVCLPPSPHSNKQDACNNAIYWIRTNVSSIAASALATKLNARMVDTNVTLLYASSNSTRSKWPNHYVRCSTWLSYHQQLLADGIWTHNPRLTRRLLYQLSYVLTFLERTAGLKPATNGLECKMNIAVWILNGFRNAPICPHDSVTRQVLDYIKLTRLLLLSYIVMRCWQ